MQTENASQDSRSAYDSDDLRMFDEITDGILAALVRAEVDPLEAAATEGLRLRIAAALFECDKEEKQDPGALRRRVLAQFRTAATSRRAIAG